MEKLILRDFIDAAPALQKLVRIETLSARTKFQLYMTIDKIDAVLSIFDKTKNELLKKYCQLSADGTKLEFVSDSASLSFNVEESNLINMEQGVDYAFIDIPIAQIEGSAITSFDMLKLGKILVNWIE